MPDWTKSMFQSFEFYEVDPITWRDINILNNKYTSATINRDDTKETKYSANISSTDDFGEKYVRIYLRTIQNNIEERFPLATVLVQTPSSDFDGKTMSTSVDAYSPLIELKECPTWLGYSLLKGTKIMENAGRICEEHARAPVTYADDTDKTVLHSDFVASMDDTWLSFLTDLVANANHDIDVNEIGEIIFKPKQEVEKLYPVWTYTDDNCSILYPRITNKRDLYGIPNVVEVVYSSGSTILYSRVENNNENSPVSIPSRGREIVKRVTNPNFYGEPTQEMIDAYAEQLLKSLSTLEYTITYTHAYCPVRVGDCVFLDIKRANLKNVKAVVKSQSIKCETGCSVEETATFTSDLLEVQNANEEV